jgi:hypothetical protein
MPATVATLRTYLGLDPASTQDDAAMGAAVAAANDLVQQLRPDLTMAVETARWIYDGDVVGADPGAGNLRVNAWSGATSDWAVSETDADGDFHSFGAVTDKTYDVHDAPAGPVIATFHVQGQATDQGPWWSWSATLTSGTVTAPAVGTSVYFWVPVTTTWAPRADQAALVEAARLYGRRGSVQGVAAFADIGVSLLPRLDPEVRSLLELGEYQPSVIA